MKTAALYPPSVLHGTVAQPQSLRCAQEAIASDGQLLHRYLPVVPMVLINGAEGIGTGWSTYIPNYNPREVAANLRRLLRGEQLVTMQPWYRGFKGTIQEVPSKTAGKSYNVYGTIAQVKSFA